MTNKERKEMADMLMGKMKSIPQLGVLYDTINRTMPGLMEMALKETLDNFNFEEKITNEEIIKRCENLLLELYDYYNISHQRFVDKYGNHIYNTIIPDAFPDAKQEYQDIWRVIISAQNDEIKKLDKSSFVKLNELYKKYKEK